MKSPPPKKLGFLDFFPYPIQATRTMLGKDSSGHARSFGPILYGTPVEAAVVSPWRWLSWLMKTKAESSPVLKAIKEAG